MNEWVEGGVGGAGKRGAWRNFTQLRTLRGRPILGGRKGSKCKNLGPGRCWLGKTREKRLQVPAERSGPRPAPLPPSQTPPPALSRPRPVSPRKPRAAVGRALAHLTLQPQQSSLRPERDSSPGSPWDQLIHGGGASGSEPGRRAASGCQGGGAPLGK